MLAVCISLSISLSISLLLLLSLFTRQKLAQEYLASLERIVVAKSALDLEQAKALAKALAQGTQVTQAEKLEPEQLIVKTDMNEAFELFTLNDEKELASLVKSDLDV